MDVLDVILLVVVLAAAIHGMRLGAAVQVVSFAGGLLGLAIGVLLVVLICPHIHGEFLRTFFALLMLLLPSSIIWGAGRQLGVRIWQHLRGHRVAALDAGGGAVIGAAGMLVMIWLLVSVLSNSEVAVISSQVQNSRVVRAVTDVMPPLPDELATVARLLNESGFPLPYLGVIQPEGPVALPNAATVGQAVSIARHSTVLIISTGGCGEVIEGSGFVVAPGLVVTNAHVVAGAKDITAEDSVQSEPATPILVDADFDLAVLRVPYLSLPALKVDPDYVDRGTKAVVMGYPGGGPFDAQPAGVLLSFDPESTNIYGTASVQRHIYELQSVVRPGNSGGPLVEPNGTVIGVVFSRDANDDDIGFALASPGVLQRIKQAEAMPAGTRVPTGACVSS
ncbi:MAG: MarP family serine protease [Acidimicrobiales bacterium]